MSISSISSDPTVYQNYASSPFQQVKKDFAALKTSLTSGDLKGAQAAFATLQQDMQTVSQAQGGQQTAGTSPLDNDLTAIGKALDSNDLSGAQAAFKTLTQDMQKMRQTQGGQQVQKTHHHHHHHHSGSAQNTQSTTSNPFTDLTAIGDALQKGDLTGAQTAFATLQQDLGTTNAQNATATSGTDLTTIGNALQSNDLAGAQNAFAKLMQDLQNTIPTLGNSANQAVGTNIDVAT
jgi:hypothetical protein